MDYLSSPSISKCTINNSASGGGGGIYYASGAANIASSCIITTNTASGSGGNGGGVYCSSSDITMTNCIIAGNTADNKGGGVHISPDSTFINCTITENTASSGGGISGSPGIVYTIINTIHWGNTPAEISGSPDVYYSNIQGGFSGSGNIDADPLLGNGYHIKAGSPCIDAGTSDAGESGQAPDTDVDGTPPTSGFGLRHWRG